MFKLAALVILLCVKNASFQQKLLNVEILYESLCPDSLNFIKNQLYPSWNDLAPYIHIKFVPFGKSASKEDGSRFVCQHGPSECVGNRIMSCALNILPEQTLQVEYVNCFMNVYKKARYNNEEFGQSCAIRLGLEWERIRQCYESYEGTLLQLEAEQTTGRIKPKFIPTILYNGVFIQEHQDASLINFKNVVCSLIKETTDQTVC